MINYVLFYLCSIHPLVGIVALLIFIATVVAILVSGTVWLGTLIDPE
jgi:hypothetical protein